MGKIFIVAEIGVNHNGDVNLGKKLIGAAARAGADAVKTQLFVAANMAAAGARKARYQAAAPDDGESQLEMLKRYELSAEKYIALRDYAQTLGLVFFAAPFDVESVRTLAKLGNPIYKVPSGEITNLPYLVEISELNARIFLSTGMSTMDEIKGAIDILRGSPSDLTILHCHTQYPTDFEDANLSAMVAIRDEFRLGVGFSDHTPGIEASVAAAALGAEVIEKHFTLDKSLPGPDHKASLEPGEFLRLVRAVRNVEKALGDGRKRATDAERQNIAIVRKSIVAAKSIRKGEVIAEDMLAAKRPGFGISPMRWRDAVGSIAGRDYAPDDMIEL